MSPELLAVLAEYQNAASDLWGADTRLDAAREKLDKLVGPLGRAWAREVRSAISKQQCWRLVKTKAYFQIDHSKRPLKGSIHCWVELIWCVGLTRGSLRLSAAWAERSTIIAGLERL